MSCSLRGRLVDSWGSTYRRHGDGSIMINIMYRDYVYVYRYNVCVGDRVVVDVVTKCI